MAQRGGANARKRARRRNLVLVLAPGRVLRSLGAIHLSAASRLGPDLRAVVTYDHRMTDAANAIGLPVVAPS